MATEFKRIQLRRGVASEWTTANTVLALGEIGYETNTKKFKIGDGTTGWNTLPYFINTTDINTLISAAVAALVDQSPSTLDTLNELAAALGDDPEFATTITELIGTKADDEHTHPDFTDIDSVEIADLQSGQVLVYSPNSEGKWVNQTLSTSYALEDLTNINITSPAPGALLQYDGQASEWVDTANLNNPIFTGEVKAGPDANNINVTISGVTGDIDTAGDISSSTLNAGSITATGELKGQMITSGVGTITPSAGVANIDFSTQAYKTCSISANTTFTASNYAAGRSVTVRIDADATTRNVAFPLGWRFIGSRPTSVIGGRSLVINIECFGNNESDCVVTFSTQSAYARPTYIGGGSASLTSLSATNTFAFPSFVNGPLVPGDIVFAFCAAGFSSDTLFSNSAGWTKINDIYVNNTGNNDTNAAIFYKIMGSTPDTNIVIGSSGTSSSTSPVVIFHAWRGVRVSNPLDVSYVEASHAVSATTSALANPAPITPVTQNALVLVFIASAHTGAVDTYSHSGLTNVVSLGTDEGTGIDTSAAIGSFETWTSGAYDPAVFTFTQADSTNFSSVAITLALSPA